MSAPPRRRIVHFLITGLVAALLPAAAAAPVAAGPAEGSQADDAQAEGGTDSLLSDITVVAPLGASLDQPSGLKADIDGQLVILTDGHELVIGDTPAETSVGMSAAALDRADRVLIARDDTFADALSSASLQAGGSPLMLVPGDGPVPSLIVEHIVELEASEAVILGGEMAVSADVAQELTELGLQVSRLSGADRVQTAAAIAAAAELDSDTALIARAFGDAGEDPTRAWADAVAAGGWAAGTGKPILLTDTDELSGDTRQALIDGGYGRAIVIGGPAAISADVEAALTEVVDVVERVSGPDRYGTALAIAEAWDAEVAAGAAPADPRGGVLLPGDRETNWQAGLTASITGRSHGLRVLTYPLGVGVPETVGDYIAEQREVAEGSTFAQGAFLPWLWAMGAGIDHYFRYALEEVRRQALSDFGSLDYAIDIVNPDGTAVGPDDLSNGDETARFTVGEDPRLSGGTLSLLHIPSRRKEKGSSCAEARIGDVVGVTEVTAADGACLGLSDGVLRAQLRFDGFRHLVIAADRRYEAAPPDPGPVLAIASFTADGSAVHIVDDLGRVSPSAQPVNLEAAVFAIDVTPSGDLITVTDGSDGVVPEVARHALTRTAQGVDVSSTVLWTGDLNGQANNPSVSPDGSMVAFGWEDVEGTSIAPSVRVVPAAGGTEVIVDDAGAGCVNDQAWSADGSTLHWWLGERPSAPSDQARSAAADGSGQVTALHDGGVRPAVSVDGVTIDSDGDTLIRTENGVRTEVQIPGATLSAASWSPDGQRFVVLAATSGATEMLVFEGDLSARDSTALPAGVVATGTDSPPEWGPGQLIALPAKDEVAVFRAGSTELSLISDSQIAVSGVDEVVDVAWRPSGG